MSSSDPGGRRFLRWAAALALASVAVLTAAAAAVDPLGVLAATPAGTLRLCADGPKTTDERAWAPMLYAARPAPEAIIGSSRALRGFSRPAGREIVNLSLSGAGLSEIAGLARDAAATGRLRRVWLVLDFPAFVAPSASEGGGGTRSGPAPRGEAARMATGLASPAAWAGSFDVARRPRECLHPGRGPSGFMVAPDEPGHRAMSLRQAAMLRGRLARPDGERRARYASAMTLLETLAGDLRGQGVEVVLVAAPFAPDYERQAAAAGLEPWRTRWLADLDAAAAATGARVLLPSIGEADFMDATHFRPAVGDRLLDARPLAPPPG